MRMKTLLIVLAAIAALAACAALWFVLRPAMRPVDGDGMVNTDGWKHEAVNGAWASGDGKFRLDIDGFDFTLRLDGVSVFAARLRFITEQQPDDPAGRFDMKIEPGTEVRPEADGAASCEVLELWHEGDAIYIRTASGIPGSDGGTVALARIETGG